jgi:hypothetical protein
MNIKSIKTLISQGENLKYVKLYSKGADPQLVEEDIFKKTGGYYIIE